MENQPKWHGHLWSPVTFKANGHLCLSFSPYGAPGTVTMATITWVDPLGLWWWGQNHLHLQLSSCPSSQHHHATRLWKGSAHQNSTEIIEMFLTQFYSTGFLLLPSYMMLYWLWLCCIKNQPQAIMQNISKKVQKQGKFVSITQLNSKGDHWLEDTY